MEIESHFIEFSPWLPNNVHPEDAFRGLENKLKAVLEELMGQTSQTSVGLRLLHYLQKVNFLRLAREDGMWKRTLFAEITLLRFQSPLPLIPVLERGQLGVQQCQK